MYACPECGSENVAGLPACHCGADLSALLQLNAVADSWFNRGIEAGRRHRLGEALEWLAGCRAARPADAECLRALAKVWCGLGLPDEALRCLDEALALSPDDSSALFLKAYVDRKRRLDPTDGQAAGATTSQAPRGGVGGGGDGRGANPS